jgi:RNA polymerase sigma-70 factor (ECF subfamily)
MLLHEARAAARTDHRGELVPFTAQEHSRYDTAAIAEARQLLAETAAVAGELGSYQTHAAIAAVQTGPDAPTTSTTNCS